MNIDSAPGKDDHPFELYLQLNDIEHRHTQVRRPQTNGFVKRFQGTVLAEFLRIVFRTKLYETVEALQADLDAVCTQKMSDSQRESRALIA